MAISRTAPTNPLQQEKQIRAVDVSYKLPTRGKTPPTSTTKPTATGHAIHIRRDLLYTLLVASIILVLELFIWWRMK